MRFLSNCVMDKKNILIIYYNKWSYPFINTIQKHLYSWKSYSKHNIIYFNVAYFLPRNILKKLNIDIIIFHTIFLSTRWSRELFKKYLKVISFFKKTNCKKIAIPQDEFLNTDLLNDFINKFKIDYVLTTANKNEWQKIYDEVDFKKVKFYTVLTGYIDKESVKSVKNLESKGIKREIDIGYRTKKARYWLGEQGIRKAMIAEIFKREAELKGLRTDISLRRKDTLFGDKWFEFLLKCTCTIGAEGGASILDKYGRIREKVDDYIKKYPNATFEEARDNCFKDEDNKLDLACISPRHLEACITKTCQFLIEGKYSGILIPWKHYIPVKKDYSNVGKILDIFKDKYIIKKITEQAYDDIVKSGKYTYENFVKRIEELIIDKQLSNKKVNNNSLLIRILELIEGINWFLVIIRNRVHRLLPDKFLIFLKLSYKKYYKN